MNNDLISRQAAIDQLHQSYNLLDAERRLEDMPSAQPVARDNNVLSNDLISRKAAIDAIKNNIMPTKEGFYEPCEVFAVLNEVPFAQLEPCEDAVSRDDVLCNIDKLVNQSDDGLLEPEDVIVSVSYLPSVTPKQRSFSCGQENDLISRKSATDALGERPMVWMDDDEYALGERNQYDIDRLAIETVPSAHSGRNHGHWVHRGCGVFECDHCGELVTTNVYKDEKASDRFKFCPSCGFDMREGEQDG